MVGSSVQGALPRVLLISPVAVTPQMSGPGIRYWEFASTLSQQQSVTLLSPQPTQMQHPRFDLKHCSTFPCLKRAITEHDIVILQGFTLFHHSELLDVLENRDNYLAIDLYTPLDLEGLELRPNTSEDAVDWNLVDVSVLKQQIKLGDFFFCASERQRDYYLGMLSALGRLNPHTYWKDCTARDLIDVVPFGLPSTSPVHREPILKGVHPSIRNTDKVLLWFGGLWNWLDPLTIVRSFASVTPKHPEAKLVFVTQIPEDLADTASAMAADTITLSKELNLYGEQIIFCEGIPFNERESLLLEADVGLCYHPNHLETRFSFRTRILDYIWASLPIITGAGDVLGKLVQEKALGYAIPPGEEEKMTQAMFAILQEPHPRASRQKAFERIQHRFTWETVIAPLAEFCQNPWHAGDHNVKTYRKHRSPNLDKLLCENIHYKHRVDTLLSQLKGQETLLQQKDALITDIMNGRIMRLITSIQEKWRNLSRLGHRSEDSPTTSTGGKE
jgi:glycosyltransferase involved in cell wall biosynthesis